MAENRFSILFRKLSEADADASKLTESMSEANSAELQEIAELRRLVLEITEPEPNSYTTT